MSDVGARLLLSRYRVKVICNVSRDSRLWFISFAQSATIKHHLLTMAAAVVLPAFDKTSQVDVVSNGYTDKTTLNTTVPVVVDGEAHVPTDDSLCTIDELLRHRARLYPDDHVVSYPSSGISFVDYSLRQLDVFALRVAKLYSDYLPARASSVEKPTVVALLGPSNIEYFVTMLALSKLGHSVLLLSTRIPLVAIESLLETTGAAALIAESRHSKTAQQVQASRPSTQVLKLAGRDCFEFPIEEVFDTRLDYNLDPEIEKTNIAWIIHSSGAYLDATASSLQGT